MARRGRRAARRGARGQALHPPLCPTFQPPPSNPHLALQAAAARGDVAAAAAALAAARRAAPVAPLPLSLIDRALLTASTHVSRALATPAPSADARRATLRAARSAAAALVECAAGELDAGPTRHTPASLTRLLCACEAAGLPSLGAAVVRWAAAAGAGPPAARPPPLGAGRPPTPLPPPAGLTALVRALAKTGRSAEAADLTSAVARAGGALDARVFDAAVRYGGRAPGGVGAAPAHAALEAAAAAGFKPTAHTFSALVRAELDAGSLPNALWAADRAAAAGVGLTPAAWAALEARAGARFGGAGAAAVAARATAAAPSWSGLDAAAAAAPPGRAPANIAYDYSSEEE